MDKHNLYLQYIGAAVPNLAIRSARLHTKDGQFNDIVIVNDEYIFRFPRSTHAATTMAREVQLLNRLRSYVSLPVPEPLYTRLDPQTAVPFMGYSMIPGAPLWTTTLATIQDEAVITRLAHQLATFLRDMHSIPPVALGVDIPLEDDVPYWTAMHEQVRTHLYPHMRPQAREEVSAEFNELIREVEAATYEPVARHGDFGSSNILYEPSSEAISGIVDFSSTAPGDPAVDVAALLASYGEAFVARCRSVYPQIEQMLGRARLIRRTFALQEALIGVQHDDQSAFENGIAAYR